jgi:geranylgeranyl diphosphate synthase, type II
MSVARLPSGTAVDGATEAVTAFHRRLAHYRDLISPALLRCLPTGEPQRYLYEPIRSYFEPVGKGLRPALCIAACRAFGGTAERAMVSASALELLHTAFLIHDDIEDGSESRREQPTMHRRYGMPLALNAGDALQALGVRTLLGNLPTLGPLTTFQVLEEFDHLIIESLEGQALELGWIRDNRCDVTEADYLRMILKKTCWYSFIHPSRIGALLAGVAYDQLNRFNRFGYFAGAAFQIQDDLLNLVGDEQRYGKEIGGDLWEGKRTLILAHVFSSADTHERELIHRILSLSRAERSVREVQALSNLIRAHGSLEYARAVGHALALAASRAFEDAFRDAPESEDKQFVRDMVRFLVERDH